MSRSRRPESQLPPPRDSYRHGDLRRALIEAGIALARAGGPEAVVLREATRRAGVVPNAAYRHFENRDALLEAVRAAALAALARAIEQELANAECKPDSSLRAARAKLHAVGAGYLRFAREHTGLFLTAFSTAGQAAVSKEMVARRGASGLNPFELLGSALDQMQAAGALPAEKRPGAEYLAWSAVHGMALLLIDGRLRASSDSEVAELGERLVTMVADGLSEPAA